MRVAPCKGCADRYSGCHDRCGGYQEWKKEREEIREASHHQKEIRATLIDGTMRRCKSRTENNTLNHCRESKRRKRQ